MARENIMLCYPFEEKRLLKWKAPYFIQRKLDGERCRAICKEDKVILISSEGNIFNYLPHINSALGKLKLDGHELDGELYCHGMPFSDIHGICSRKVNPHPEYAMMEYHIFDVVNGLTQDLRFNQLKDLQERIVNFNCQEELKVVSPSPVSTLDEILEAFDDYVSEGYEGFILRDSEGYYIRKRSTRIMKFKPHKEDVYAITGFQEEYSMDGVPKNSLGAFICVGDDGTYFNVGSGPALTKDLRKYYWETKEDLFGKYLRVKYQNITTGKGVPRFPVAIQVLDLNPQRPE